MSLLFIRESCWSGCDDQENDSYQSKDAYNGFVLAEHVDQGANETPKENAHQRCKTDNHEFWVSIWSISTFHRNEGYVESIRVICV